MSLLSTDGFDAESVAEELSIDDPDENQLMEFFEDVDDFPMATHQKGLSEDDKKMFIMKMMVKLHKNPKLVFDHQLPECLVSGRHDLFS